MDRCPRCGYELPKGKKTVIRIWAAKLIEKDWEDWAKNFDTKGLALNELLRKARLYDKEHERSRLAVEVSTEPRV